ncbi:lipase 3-like [Periplaneta americana]|uniref:lipase 3-like n=1 Tax=Periplaneta americana TaxID=6978 RepID=UPI0037E81536
MLQYRSSHSLENIREKMSHLSLGAVVFAVVQLVRCCEGYNSDEFRPTPDLIRSHNYSVESYKVITADNYILAMHRISGSPKAGKCERKPVVFLQHGMLGSSADWVILGPEKSLGYLLADQCYDVWLGNSRGNRYSRKHRTLSTEDFNFWDFSWHEMGLYDLPAEIDYILKKTHKKQLFYVGHSMGTTMFYVLMSRRPEYNNKVVHMTSLAPVAYMEHVRSPLIRLASKLPGPNTILEVLRYFGTGEYQPNADLYRVMTDTGCPARVFKQPKLSRNSAFLLTGYDPSELEKDELSLVLGHFPSGTSTKTVLHYAQEIYSPDGGFREWDTRIQIFRPFYVMHDGAPPSYELNKISVPVTLFYSDNDIFVGVEDVQRLNRTLGHSVGEHHIPVPTFSHMDFILGRDVRTLVNDVVIAIIGSFAF